MTIRRGYSIPLFEIKSIDDKGTFSGYGAVFGNKDHGGDIIVAGAFGQSLADHRKRGTRPKLLWQHDPHEPIGKWTDMAEDGKGLWIEGKFNMGVQRAQEAYALLKEGDIDGLSIGYGVDEAEPDPKRGATLLKRLHLYEVSVVSMAMNDRARVETVKADDWAEFARRVRDGEPPSIAEFEKLLRDAGFPKSMAVRIASHGYAKAFRGDPEGDQANDQSIAFLRALLGRETST